MKFLNKKEKLQFFNKEKNIIIDGVAAVLNDTKGNLILVLEKENKPWKKAGQWSVMMETVEAKDNSLEDAIRRGLKEELGINLGYGELIKSKNLVINAFVFKDGNIIRVRLFVFQVVLTKDQVEQAIKFSNGEIGKVKIVSLKDILSGKISPLRPGMIESILGYNDDLYIKDGDYSPFKF